MDLFLFVSGGLFIFGLFALGALLGVKGFKVDVVFLLVFLFLLLSALLFLFFVHLLLLFLYAFFVVEFQECVVSFKFAWMAILNNSSLLHDQDTITVLSVVYGVSYEDDGFSSRMEVFAKHIMEYVLADVGVESW